MSVPSEPTDPDKNIAPSSGRYFARVEALQLRVNEAARALHERGIRPTVARIRAALGGGSPNDLAPALKRWKESVLPGLPAGNGLPDDNIPRVAIPPMIADLAYELWQRATAAAAVELKGGPTAQRVIARTEEAQALRSQLTALRDQLQRDALSYGELRAHSARHEAIATDALAQVRDADKRARDLFRDLGTANQRIAKLEAIVEQSRARELAAAAAARRAKTNRARLGAKQSRLQPVTSRHRAAKLKLSRPSPNLRPRPKARHGRKTRRR